MSGFKTAFILANIFLWSAFGALTYNYVNLALSGALIPGWLFMLIGVILVFAALFSYGTALIFEKVTG
jgi:type IV secretory pathway TrbL component